MDSWPTVCFSCSDCSSSQSGVTAFQEICDKMISRSFLGERGFLTGFYNLLSNRFKLVPVVGRRASVSRSIPSGKRILMLPLAVHQKAHHRVRIPCPGDKHFGTHSHFTSSQRWCCERTNCGVLNREKHNIKKDVLSLCHLFEHHSQR